MVTLGILALASEVNAKTIMCIGKNITFDDRSTSMYSDVYTLKYSNKMAVIINPNKSVDSYESIIFEDDMGIYRDKEKGEKLSISTIGNTANVTIVWKSLTSNAGATVNFLNCTKK